MKARTNSTHHRKAQQKSEEAQKKVNSSGMKIKWTSIEDEKLIKAVEKYHHKNWKLIANEVSSRSPKQCLERWYGMLDPSLIKTEFTPEEDQIIVDMQNRLGNKWTLIAECLPGRSAISVRNRSDLLKRHAKNPSLSKLHPKEVNSNESSSFSFNDAQSSDFSFQMKSETSEIEHQFEIHNKSIKNQIKGKGFEETKSQNDFLEIFKNNELQKYFSGNSWIELDRYFSNFDDLIFWNQNELF